MKEGRETDSPGLIDSLPCLIAWLDHLAMRKRGRPASKPVEPEPEPEPEPESEESESEVLANVAESESEVLVDVAISPRGPWRARV